MIWFRENWYEELLRQLNEGLSLCQAAAFESRADGMLHCHIHVCILCEIIAGNSIESHPYCLNKT